MAEHTYCEDCDHVDSQTRKRAKYYWLCLMHPNVEGAGFVARNEWVSGEPYLRCKDVNGGMCRLFKERRNAEAHAPIDDVIPH